MMVLDLGNYRKVANGAIQPAARRHALWSLPRMGTLQFLLKAAVAVRAGKA